jgi:hypothetical protein
MMQESMKSWYRWPFRIVLFAAGLIWLGQALYAGRLLVVEGPRGVLSWLYHIARSTTADGQAVVPTTWDVVAREGSLLVLTVVMWFASGLPMWPRRPRKRP